MKRAVSGAGGAGGVGSAGAAGARGVARVLGEEIGKRGPFEAPEVEAYLNLVRTSAILSGELARFFKRHGLTEAKYNALRILRGHRDAGERGVPCATIAAELVAPAPDVTRIVDGLVKAGLADRDRGHTDRRVVLVRITAKGLRLLSGMDEPLLALHRAALGHMNRKDLAALSDLLARARAGAGGDGRAD